LPKSLYQECTDLVNIYSKTLVELLIKGMAPHEVCSYIKLCEKTVEGKQKLSFGQNIVAVPQNDFQGKQACALCEYLLHYIQQALTDPKTEVLKLFYNFILFSLWLNFSF
jgi:saposin